MMQTPTTPPAPSLAGLVRQRDAAALAKALLNVHLTPGQARIARRFAFLERRRVVISAHTRYGKSFAAAVGVVLLILLNPRPLKIRIIAPTDEQTKIIRGYVVELLLAMPSRVRDEVLAIDASGAERLRKETSRRRITFRDGKDLRVISAQGEGNRLMGWGGEVIIVDESCLLDEGVMRAKVMRMLADHPRGGWLFELSNPWHSGNHFFRHWNDAAYEQIHIEHEQGVAEGRVSRAYVEEQRRELTPQEFQILWESRFPDAADSQLIPWPHIRAAHIDPDAGVPEGGRVRYALDVAEGGGDWNVLTRSRHLDDGRRVVDWQKAWSYDDTEKTVERAAGLMEPGAEVVVDAGGVGKGVADGLRRLLFNVIAYKGSEAPRDANRFLNAKAELKWQARLLLEQRMILIVGKTPELDNDLSRFRWELRQNQGKARILVMHEGSKSPDHGDSFTYAVAGRPPKPKPQAFDVAR